MANTRIIKKNQDDHGRSKESLFSCGLYLLVCLNISSFAFSYFYWSFLGVDMLDHADLSNVIMASGPLPVLFAFTVIAAMYELNIGTTDRGLINPLNLKKLRSLKSAKRRQHYFWLGAVLIFFAGGYSNIENAELCLSLAYAFAGLIMVSAPAYYIRHPDLVKSYGKKTSIVCIAATMIGIYSVIALPALEAKVALGRDHGTVRTKEGKSLSYFGRIGEMVFFLDGKKISATPISNIEKLETSKNLEKLF